MPRSTPRRRHGSALLGSLLCTACAAVPDLGPTPEPRPAAPLVAGLSTTPEADTAGSEASWPRTDWWDAYSDPQLTGLIAEALAGSPSLAEAAARLRRATGLAEQAGARLNPTLDATAETGFVRQSERLGTPPGALPEGWNDRTAIGLSAGLDLDLWGRNRALLTAAMADLEAAEADAAAIRLALSTAVAAAYADLIRLHALRDAAETDLRLQTEGAALTRARRDEGLEADAAVARGDAGRARSAADLAAADEAIGVQRNLLAALLGAGPDRGRATARPSVPDLHGQDLPADLALDLVGRRPDLVAARRRVEAAASRIEAARADFYPNLRLSALIGLDALGIGDLLEGGAVTGAVGPALSLPIFSGGRLEGAFRAARAEFDLAVATYDRTLIEAVREIADLLVRRASLVRRLDAGRDAVAFAARAHELVAARYRGGLAPYFEVLAAEDSLNANRRALADLEAGAFALEIGLVRALGGGFTDQEPQL